MASKFAKTFDDGFGLFSSKREKKTLYNSWAGSLMSILSHC
jgi:hypothetical protein